MTQNRKTHTKTYIKQSFTQLLKEITFEKISVTKICQKAGINRGTFYLHYLDKFDMIEKMRLDIFNDLYQIIAQEERTFSQPTILAIIQYLADDFDFIATVTRCNFADFSQSIHDFLTNLIDNTDNMSTILQERYKIPLTYAKTIYISSIQAIVIKWIESGGTESSYEVTEMILKIC